MRLRTPYPAEIVLDPSWWHDREGICFDQDFFLDADRRIQDELHMERALRERFGLLCGGQNVNQPRPEIGAVHLASGFFLSWMLGCEVEFFEDRPPAVHPMDAPSLDIDVDAAFRSQPFQRLEKMVGELLDGCGFLTGDINFSGVLNLALDVRGMELFFDIKDRPKEVASFFWKLAELIERFTDWISAKTGTTSISVNRTVRHFDEPIFLHSECSLTMLSTEDYQSLIAPIDRRWSERYAAFGIHYCGADPHRYKDAFAQLKRLDFLDVGWGGDVAALREALPEAFLNLRLSPVEMARWTPEEICACVHAMAIQAKEPYKTGFCCINMDASTKDRQIQALLDSVQELREDVKRADV